MLAIAIFFIGHWLSSVFFQTFFLHRYGAHKQFTMSERWERIFYFATWLTQGSSFLEPRGYAISRSRSRSVWPAPGGLERPVSPQAP